MGKSQLLKELKSIYDNIIARDNAESEAYTLIQQAYDVFSDFINSLGDHGLSSKVTQYVDNMPTLDIFNSMALLGHVINNMKDESPEYYEEWINSDADFVESLINEAKSIGNDFIAYHRAFFDQLSLFQK